jgi:rfaE bifunctional protein nucleotidyltransferase chain/domain
MKSSHIVISREAGKGLSQSLRKTGLKLVFSNGVFDILHIGHVKYLKEAKSLGDVLIVGVNSDRSATFHKGALRPFINQDERATIISSLFCVDYVIIFDEDTPIKLIQELKPDIYVKGGDYKAEDVPEFETVKSYGGKTHILSYTYGKSTTKIIKQIRSYGRDIK